MKKTLVLMAVVVFATSSFSQTQTHPDFFAEALQLRAAGTSTLVSLKDSSYWNSNWNDATGTWGFIYRNIYHYNSFYEEDGNVSANDDGSGSGWINFENTKNYLYDSNHRLLEATLEDWSGSWNNYHKYTYTYDVAGNLLKKTDQRWASGAWINHSRSTYTYSGNNRTVALHQYWDSTTNSWTDNTRTTFAYTGNQLTSGTEENWHGTQWINAMRKINFVYAGTDLLSYESEMWNLGTGIYELKVRTSFNYDANHHMLASFLELRNVQASTWEKYLKTDYSYDAQWNQTRIMEQGWDVSSANWKNSSLIVHYYRTGTVGVNEISANKTISVYPNPATDRITVSTPGSEASTLIITDLAGKTVLSSETGNTASLSIDIRGFEAGMYFIELKNEQGSAKGKFIKD